MGWTQAEETKLKELVQSGLTYLQVSKILNKSKNAVLGKANRLNLPYIALKNKNNRKVKKPPSGFEPYVPRVLPDAPVSLNMKLLDLEKHNCRYIPGDDRLFCGHNTVEGSSYCEYHKAVCCSPIPLPALKY